MKRYFRYLLLIVFALPVLASCGKDNDILPDEDDGSDDVTIVENRKILVAYFSGTGNTKRLAEQIAAITKADIFRIEAKEPYSANPYDDSDRIQNESYNNLRPEVAVLPDNVESYDVIFVGSPIWWHNPAMVVCTFLENYKLDNKIVVPFFTYGATTYLQQSVNKIYEVTPNSTHLQTYTSGSVEAWLKSINIIQ